MKRITKHRPSGPVPPITHAFLCIRTRQDILDTYDLLARGVRVGFEPVGNLVYGQISAPDIKFQEKLEIREGWMEDFYLDKYPSHRFWVRAQTLREFVEKILDNQRPASWVMCECPVELQPIIKEALFILNFGSQGPLGALVITRLIHLFARHLNGTIEPQLAYGHPDWIQFVKEGLGAIVCWCHPHPKDIEDMLPTVQGLINATNAMAMTERNGKYFAGFCDGRLMADKSVLRVTDPFDPIETYKCSGEPTGIEGPDWDYLAKCRRMCGFKVDHTLGYKKRRAPAWPASKASRKFLLPYPADFVCSVQDGINWMVPGNLHKATLLNYTRMDIKRDAKWFDLYWPALIAVNLSGAYPEQTNQCSHSSTQVELSEVNLVDNDSGPDDSQETFEEPQ